MPIDFNFDFVTSSTRSSALSLTSSTGLTINNQVIGGLHAYHSLNNIINGSADNKIPPIFTQGGTTSQPTTLTGCNDSDRCIASANAVDFGQTPGTDITSFMESALGLQSGQFCGNADNASIAANYCSYEGTIDITNPSSLELNSDLVSSGRLQLGMVVYISEKSQSYQFIIDDYETLYNAAETSGDITTTTFTTAVGDGNAGGAAFIEAWTVHKVEGELKDPLDEDLGRWSRDEANWKIFKPEYVSINSVPASEVIDDFNFSDAAIVVPAAWHGKKIVAVSAAIHNAPETFNGGNITINQVLASNQTTNSVTYQHPSDDQFLPHASLAPDWTLQAGSLLYLSTSSTFGTNCKGYTATLQIV